MQTGGFPFARWVPPVVAMAGLSIAGVGAAADRWGVSSTPGVGPAQFVMIAVGLAVFAAAGLLLKPGPQKALSRWRMPAGERDAAGVLLCAVWFGVIAGLLDPILTRLQNLLGLRFIYVNPHLTWMSPVSYVGLLLALTLVLLLVARGPWSWLGSMRAAGAVIAATITCSLVLIYNPEVHELAAVAVAVGVAVQVWRVVGRHPMAFRRAMQRTVIPLIVLVVVAAAIAVGGPWAFERRARARLADAPSSAPNVLLIILDTVRGANVSFHGYTRATTPHLAKRASEGVVFERAIAPAPWSLPSHASVITGRYPHSMAADWLAPLEDSLPTLAEILQARGYLTGGFLANRKFGGKHTGLNRGFLHWDVDVTWPSEIFSGSMLGRMLMKPNRLALGMGSGNHLGQKDAPTVSREFLDWVDQADGRPFFAFLNYFDAHGPYKPPEPYDRKFSLQDSPDLPFVSAKNERHSVAQELAAYDGAIAYLDEQLDAMFEELDAMGVLENTLVIVTSDHGEEFSEKGIEGHGRSLSFSVVHVPLVMWLPRRLPAGARVSTVVSLRDVPSTVMRVTGAGEKDFPGRSLTRFWDSGHVNVGEPAAPNETGTFVLAEVTRRDWIDDSGQRQSGNLVAVFDGSLHYIRQGVVAEELYDIQTDPWEQRDLSGIAEYALDLHRLRRIADSIGHGYMKRDPRAR